MMKHFTIFNQLNAIGKRFAMLLTMILVVGVGTVWGAEATLSFADKAQRTSFSTSQQVWEQNGITFTNNKASSSNNVADYANPVRLYASSSVTIECSLGNITQIVFDCNSSSYATAMENSIGTVSGATVSVSSDKVTVTFTSAVASFTIAQLTAQIRLDAITVTYEEEVKQSATIVLSEAGTENTVNGTFYKDDSYTLPSSTDAKCGGKVLVGWSIVKVEEIDTKPTSNYYDKGTSVSLKAGENKFYAVFATKTTTTGGTTTTEKTITEDFEKQTAGSVYNSTQAYAAANSNAGIAWKMYYGTVSTNAYLSGSKSAQMRWYDSAPSNLPYVQTTAIVKGLKSISFKTLTSDNDYKYSVSYSTDNSTWTNVATSQSVGSTSNTQTKSYTINANGVDAYIKIAITSTSSVSDKATFRIDDVVFTYLETTTGGTTITYSDYTTQCVTETTICAYHNIR